MGTIAIGNGELHQVGHSFTPCIITIAKSLAYINRFTGHVGQYSVAQHCVLASQIISKEHPKLALSALLHDATEAYIGDVSAPLKRVIGPQYRQLELFYHHIIDCHFDVDTEHEQVREVDLRLCTTEARAFSLPEKHFQFAKPYGWDVERLVQQRWSPEQAEWTFMRTFNRLSACVRNNNIIQADVDVCFQPEWEADRFDAMSYQVHGRD